MFDPYAILGVTPNDDDATIRQRYLTLIQLHSPETQPLEFARLRKAYELVKDTESRVEFLLMPKLEPITLEEIITEAECSLPRPRVSLTTLLRN